MKATPAIGHTIGSPSSAENPKLTEDQNRKGRAARNSPRSSTKPSNRFTLTPLSKRIRRLADDVDADTSVLQNAGARTTIFDYFQSTAN